MQRIKQRQYDPAKIRRAMARALAPFSLCLLAIIPACSDSEGGSSNTGGQSGNTASGGASTTGGQSAGGTGGTASDVCALPQLTGIGGMCAAYIPSFWHNPQTNACEPYVYGGCGATANRFESLAACQAACDATH